MGVSTVCHAIHYASGFGDEITFASNVASDAVTTAGTIGIVAFTTEMFAAMSIKTRNPLVIGISTEVGFVSELVLDHAAEKYGLQKEIEHGLRALEAKDLHTPSGVLRNVNNFFEFQSQRDTISDFRERFQQETKYIQHNTQLNYWEKQREYRNELKRKQRNDSISPIG